MQNSTEKKISIIVPVYNAEKTISRCVDSIICQSYKNLEIILVDDGSSDNSYNICKSYTKKDARIKLFHQENQGVSAARNYGLNNVTGEYCTFVDSDDYLNSQMYSSMMSAVRKYDCDVVLCDCYKDYSDGSKQLYSHAIREGYYNRDQLEKEYFPHLLIMPDMEYPATISICLCLFKTNLIFNDEEKLKIKFADHIRFSEDLLFGAELLYNANSFYYMKGTALYHYVMNSQSATHTFQADKWDDYVRLYNLIVNAFGKSKVSDFSTQIDKVLLFFVYNTVGDIITTSQLDQKEKLDKCNAILKSDIVKQMFKNIRISRMPVSVKLKLQTYIYKYRFPLKLFIMYKIRTQEL